MLGEIILTAINGMGMDDKSLWKTSPLNRLRDIFNRIKRLATKTLHEFPAESLYVAAHGNISFDGLNHNCISLCLETSIHLQSLSKGWLVSEGSQAVKEPRLGAHSLSRCD